MTYRLCSITVALSLLLFASACGCDEGAENVDRKGKAKAVAETNENADGLVGSFVGDWTIKLTPEEQSQLDMMKPQAESGKKDIATQIARSIISTLDRKMTVTADTLAMKVGNEETRSTYKAKEKDGVLVLTTITETGGRKEIKAITIVFLKDGTISMTKEGDAKFMVFEKAS